MTINVNPELGAPFGIMLLVDFIIFQLSPIRINQNQFPNTPKSFLSALVAFGIFFVLSLILTFIFQPTAIVQGTIDIAKPESLVQVTMRHGFAATGLEQATAGQAEPIFAGSKIATYITFVFVVAYIETRFIIMLMVALANLFGVSIRRFTTTLLLIYVFIAGGFVWFHANVKGVEDTVSLIMTFIFAIITFELARRHQEMESGTHLHFINNLVFIWNRIGF